MNEILYQIKKYWNELIVEIQWLEYKYFHKTRTIPCGRTKQNKYLCCCQPFIPKRMYLSENKEECYCKVCNYIKISANHSIDMNNLWN